MTEPSSPDVALETRDDIAWIRLQRPERRNAYDLAMAEQISAFLNETHMADAVVITGSGGSFCAGGFLGALSEPQPEDLRRLFFASYRMLDAIRVHPRPVIAAVDGPAAGGGNEIVIACDFAIATRRSTFGQTGPRIGSAPVLGATNLAAVQIGEKFAKEMSMLCRRYSAEEARALGLINEVTADDQLESRLGDWIEEIRALSPRYLEIAKATSNVWWNASRDSMLMGIESLVQAIGSEDMIEGARAFLEKRQPRFRAKTHGSANKEADQ